MKTHHWILPMLATMLLVGWLAACSGDDPVAPEGDRTPPIVIQSWPSDGVGGVDVDDEIYVTFSKAMDTASVEDAISLAGGTVTGTSWSSDRELIISHTDFARGALVAFTLGRGAKDMAGNGLAAPYTAEFLVESDHLVLMGMSPEDGTTGVPVNTGIVLRFDETVWHNEISDRVRVHEVGSAVAIPFTVGSLDGSPRLLQPVDPLPAETVIQVEIPEDLPAYSGKTPAAAIAFSFTTGSDSDTTPPSIIAAHPANGSTHVSPDQGYLRFTFDEAVDTGSVRFNPANFALFMMMSAGGFSSHPYWSEGNTVATLELPSGLPDGLPICMTIEGIRDLNGVEQTEPFSYEIRVAGTADYLPIVDGTLVLELGEWEEGVVGNDEPQDSGQIERPFMIRELDDGYFRELELEFSMVETGLWTGFRKTSSALQLTGREDGPVKSIDFTPPLTILPLPFSAGTWTASATTGVGDEVHALQGRVLARGDHYSDLVSVVVKDAWVAVLQSGIARGSVPVSARVDTVVYGPTVGACLITSEETDIALNRWRREGFMRMYLDPTEKDKVAEFLRRR